MKCDFDQTPFIKKFRTEKHYYIYDVNRNDLLRVNRIIYDMIDLVGEDDVDAIVNELSHKYKSEDIRENFERINKAKQDNYYSSYRAKISSGEKTVKSLKNLLSSGLKQIVLDLTTRCNLRCKYCTFSGSYLYSREHEERDMPFEIARRAVEFFMERSSGNQNEISPAITFMEENRY